MSQPLWHSIPYLCILLPLGSAAVTSVLKPRWARYWTMFALLVVTSLSGVISAIFASGAESYTYMMGHFPAPWGNEIRAGQLEAVTALFCDALHDHEPDRLRSFPAGHHPAV